MRPRADTPILVSAFISIEKNCLIAAAMGNFGIPLLWDRISAFTVRGPVPRAKRNHSFCVSARAFKGAFVLLRAVDVIRELVVQIHMIKLRGRLVVLGCPGLTAIDGNGGTAVIAFE